MPPYRPSQPRDVLAPMLPRSRYIATYTCDKHSIRATVRFLQMRWEQGAMACQSEEEQHQLLAVLKREQVLVVE